MLPADACMCRGLGREGCGGGEAGVGAGEGWSPTSGFQRFPPAVQEPMDGGGPRGLRGEGPVGQSLRDWWECRVGHAGWNEAVPCLGELLPGSV